MAARAVEIAMQQIATYGAAKPAGGKSATPASSIAGKLQFVLCIGDDSTDELMFSALHAKFGHKPTHMDLHTVTVGRKPSAAKTYLSDYNDVLELLKVWTLSYRSRWKCHQAPLSSSWSFHISYCIEQTHPVGNELVLRAPGLPHLCPAFPAFTPHRADLAVIRPVPCPQMLSSWGATKNLGSAAGSYCKVSKSK